VRTTLAGGVSSPKRGRNGGGGSNSDGGSSALVARCGHEDEGERGGVLARLVKERKGEKKRGVAVTRWPSYTGAAVRCGGSGVGSGRCHAVRSWGRVPTRPVGGGRLAMARPQHSLAARVRAAPNRGEAGTHW
jgi:hypothetical protein